MVYPSAESIERLGSIDFNATLDRPLDAANVIALLDEVGGAATVSNTGGRYFGFVTGGVEPVGLAASVLAGAWDQNAALPVMSPVAAHLDALASGWITDLLGLPTDASVAFCAGASIANLTAIIAARDTLLRRIGWDTQAEGLFGAPPIDIVASAEIHSSALKALRLAGLGVGSVNRIATDEFGRAKADAIPRGVLESDRPTLVVLQAGNVNTGHSDPFAERFIAGSSRRPGSTSTVPLGCGRQHRARYRHLVAGVELADSWATDAHKFLNTPYDSGIAICARPGGAETSHGD